MTKKALAIVQREYMTRFKTKGFIIGTFLFPLILVLIFSGWFLFGALFKPSTKTFHIIDQTGQMFSEFSRIQTDTLKNGELKYNFVEQDIDAGGLDATVESLQAKVVSEEIDGYMVIPQDVIDKREISYSAKNVSDFEELESFSRTYSWIATNMRLEREGLPVDRIRAEMNQGRIRVTSRQVTEEGEIEKSGGASFALSYILTYVMILMIMIYGMTVMRSVIEEKSQRITETIVSAVKPTELMLGKIFGVCGLGLTQLLIFGGFVLLVIQYGGPLLQSMGMEAPELFTFIKQIQFTPQVFGFLILFFLMGFVFYSGIFAAVGAMVNSEDEGQQYQGPLMLLIWIGFFIMLAVARNPETTQAFWISLFPLYTPIIMFARITVSDPLLPSGTLLSVIVMLASTVGIIFLTAKIYRVGILMYGKKPSFREAIKWLKYK